MITLDKAIELATKAHEGQWRTSKVLNGDRYLSYGEEVHSKNIPYHETDWHTLSDDSQIRCNGSQHQRFPYITHPLAVMEMMDTDEEKIVAVLHDVFEKCSGWCLGRVMDDSKFYIKYQPENIEYIITANIYWVLILISKDKYIKYNDYIYNMIHAIKLDGTPNKLAIKVKLADIVCNLADSPSEHAKQKYLKALPILLKGI